MWPIMEQKLARFRELEAQLSDPAVVTDIHGQFADLGVYERHVLPTDGLDPEATIEAVIAALESGDYRLP